MSQYFDKWLEITKELETEHDKLQKEKIEKWYKSPFLWLLSLPSSTKGKKVERLVEKWFESIGFEVQRATDSQADLVIAGRRVEVKMSTLWESEIYKFQQIREQNYELALCVGISPSLVHLWAIPKSILVANSTPQHGGKAAEETRWLTVQADSPPEWLKAYGGSLHNEEDVQKVIDVLKGIKE